MRRIALVLPLLAAAGCAGGSQRPASAPTNEQVSSGPVRVMGAEAPSVVLANATAGPVRDASGHIVHPAEEARKVSPRTTALIVVGLAVAAVVAIRLFAFHSECDCIH